MKRRSSFFAEHLRLLPFFLLICSLPVAGVASQPGQATDPAYYRKQSTWQETIVHSVAALKKEALQDDFAPFESGIFRGGEPPQHLSLPIHGAKQLYLFVTGCPDVKWGVADWADAWLISKTGQAVALSSLKGLKPLLGRYERDLTLRAGLYQKMRMGEREFDTGIHVQANSVLFIPLEETYERFEAWIGVDAWAGTNGSVRFSVVGARTAARKRLWELVARDFTHESARREMSWEREDRIHEKEWNDPASLAQQYAGAARRVPELAARAAQLASAVRESGGVDAVRELYYRSRRLDAAAFQVKGFDFEALRLAIEDLGGQFPEEYPKEFTLRLARLEKEAQALAAASPRDGLAQFEKLAAVHHQLESLKREALLSNPLLDFERLLVIRRKPIGDPRRSQWDDKGLGEYLGVPRQSSWGNATMPNVDQWDNEIAVLSPPRPNGKLATLFKPEARPLISDLDLHFDGDKMLFGMPDRSKRWQICELRADGTGLRQLTPGEHPDVHSYDPCYLPDGQIAFISTAPLQGVPCNSSVIVGMMYKMNGDGGNIHQVCFEQDHDYNPTVLNDGRVLYLRWDYTDTPHIWNRVLMSMNPDGTGQTAYYGANSYWPNAIFYPRAIPGHSTKIAGIVTGHHEGRVGELVIFDPAKGTHETDGVVQRIPGRGRKVEPLIEDKLTEHSWPKFLHPWPLNEKYFLVSCKPEPDSLWGIYLVDVFDNMVLVREEDGAALLEPIPFRPRTKPPVIHDKVQPWRKDALVYLENVYHGPGLKGVPVGTVKNLRLFTYHFGFQTLAGIDHRVGADGPWEAKQVLGTVPVDEDGSAWFQVPAKTPISIQPLDAEGKAVALMRSWMTAMPGENVSCVGCHEQSSSVPSARRTTALTRAPSLVQPWRGPRRGFSFAREVQPVLDQYCVACHNGEKDQKVVPDLRRDQDAFVVYEHGRTQGKTIRGVPKSELLGKYSAVFDPSYVALRQYVRVGGLESDLHILPPKEFHADTSELIQMLRKGHHNVRLDENAWDRLITWIDLNAPCHGRWGEVTRVPANQQQRRLELRKLYGGVEEDCEAPAELPQEPVAPVMPEPFERPKMAPFSVAGWPFGPAEAEERQTRNNQVSRTVDLGGGVKLEFVWVPPGAFVMGDAEGELDEYPPNPVRIEKPFWMGKFEISNEEFRAFDPTHDSRFEHRSSWIFSEEYLGWPLNQPRQPVVRVSWNQALDFCRWLSGKLGEEVTLPTEAQWEYACRAGSATPLFFGDLDTDFSRHANLADANLRKLAEEGWRPKAPDLVPRDDRFNDGALVTTATGTYLPNAWGLHDLHGNAAEWTRTTYRPYPYRQTDGRDAISADGEKVVRGGSWRDRPKRSRSAFRLSYPPYQKVFNVGFRVIIEPGEKAVASVKE
jgi:formylglycine-generating enzyme required for sulfatase activity